MMKVFIMKQISFMEVIHERWKISTKIGKSKRNNESRGKGRTTRRKR
jgi:hypothetical protein